VIPVSNTSTERAAVGISSNSGHYASYGRCVKSEKISNGKRKGQGNLMGDWCASILKQRND